MKSNFTYLSKMQKEWTTPLVISRDMLLTDPESIYLEPANIEKLKFASPRCKYDCVLELNAKREVSL